MKGHDNCEPQSRNGNTNENSKATPATRSRRGGRRGRRRANQQPDANSGTVAPPVTAEDLPQHDDESMLNSTSVRRRAKPTSTVTKVVTDVSLEALRAKRNGTTVDGIPDEDDKTIEEVSRILLMYSSWLNSSGGRQCNKRFSSAQMTRACSEGSKNRGAQRNFGSGCSACSSCEGHDEQGTSGNFRGVDDVRSHILSLIQSGVLTPDVLEVLKAMLRNPPRGPKIEPRDNTNRGRNMFYHGLPDSRTHCNQRQRDEFFFHGMRPCCPCCCGCSPHLHPPDPLMENFFCYPEYPPYPDPFYYDACGNVLGGMPYGDGYSGVGCTNCNPFMDEYFPHNMHDYELEKENLPNYEKMAPAVVGKEAEEEEKPSNNDNDDDDGFAEMLRGICSSLQGGASLWGLQDGSVDRSNSPPILTEGVSNTNYVEGGGVTNLFSPLTPSVTISQSERESLRSLRQTLFAHMGQADSPDWRSPGITPSRSIWSAFVKDEKDEGGKNDNSVGHIGQGNDDENAWYSTNRTLFSYHTNSLEGGQTETPGESNRCDASVVTDVTALEYKHELNCKTTPQDKNLSLLFAEVPSGAGGCEEEPSCGWPSECA
ncbi:hypothetical protein ERJ75_001666100 [Trypanosoma vivax]|nr:hypothetical protein TRVL_06963 [Trypanosoma vivax]KAH8605027.1 hypothetical protein ERJ75_001666100 [Trypanosoma vivax]